jgi:hypothetical protein
MNRQNSTRAGLSGLVVACLVLGGIGTVQATVPTAAISAQGRYSVTDTTRKPGARCRYEGAAGTWYLQRMRVRAPTIYGASAQLRSVGYRLLLQRRKAQGWSTVQRGPLISGVADRDTAATLSDSSVARDVSVAPNEGRYRAALRLIWWDAHAHVASHAFVALKHHRRTYDASVGRACPGRAPIS